ncbi:MAG: hypothetical protein OXQ29_18415 [Rhodospirillaceae bacterium]|nr:hypothetical protein [Rhodospirillaceae bacterium]
MSTILTVAITAAFSGVGTWALTRWWENRNLRLQWIVFPPVSMMTIHKDVADKLKISYDDEAVARLAKRRFLLRNVGHRAIKAENSPLYWQAPGPVLDCGASSTAAGCDSLLTVTVNSKNTRKVDIQWDEYMNSRHEEYVDVLYDEGKCEGSSSVRLSGRRKETVITTKCVTGDYEQRRTTRTRIMAVAIVGSSITIGTHASMLQQEGLLPMVVGQLVVIVGIMVAFAKARIERMEKRQADNTEQSS